MMRRVVAFLMMGHLLVSSIILPLSDFSLLKELPRMYHAYQKVASPHEQCIVDFVGDYLLGGKDLLGHNKHDRPIKTDAMQFGHATVFAYVVQRYSITVSRINIAEATSYSVLHLPGKPTDYQSSLFRPPLA